MPFQFGGRIALTGPKNTCGLVEVSKQWGFTSFPIFTPETNQHEDVPNTANGRPSPLFYISKNPVDGSDIFDADPKGTGFSEEVYANQPIQACDNTIDIYIATDGGTREIGLGQGGIHQIVDICGSNRDGCYQQGAACDNGDSCCECSVVCQDGLCSNNGCSNVCGTDGSCRECDFRPRNGFGAVYGFRITFGNYTRVNDILNLKTVQFNGRETEESIFELRDGDTAIARITATGGSESSGGYGIQAISGCEEGCYSCTPALPCGPCYQFGTIGADGQAKGETFAPGVTIEQVNYLGNFTSVGSVPFNYIYEFIPDVMEDIFGWDHVATNGDDIFDRWAAYVYPGNKFTIGVRDAAGNCRYGDPAYPYGEHRIVGFVISQTDQAITGPTGGFQEGEDASVNGQTYCLGLLNAEPDEFKVDFRATWPALGVTNPWWEHYGVESLTVSTPNATRAVEFPEEVPASQVSLRIKRRLFVGAPSIEDQVAAFTADFLDNGMTFSIYNGSITTTPNTQFTYDHAYGTGGIGGGSYGVYSSGEGSSACIYITKEGDDFFDNTATINWTYIVSEGCTPDASQTAGWSGDQIGIWADFRDHIYPDILENETQNSLWVRFESGLSGAPMKGPNGYELI